VHEQLRAMVRAYVLGVLRNLDSVRVYLREEICAATAALRQVHVEQRTMRALFERVIGDGMRDGSFVGTDPKLAALAVLGCALGSIAGTGRGGGSPRPRSPTTSPNAPSGCCAYDGRDSPSAYDGLRS